MTRDERKFRPDVEGLRAVAVGLVVLGHAGVPGLEGGYIGVDVFFVLSGFLITGLLLRERETTGSTSMAGFYARRARRILPAATVVLIATVFASYHWLGFLRGNTIAEDGKWTAMFAANLRFASEGTQYLNVSAPPSPLQHYWSLAVEEQFYLVWPLLFLVIASVAPRMSLARKLAAVLVLVVAASFAWSVVQTRSDVAWAFFSPLTRAWELAFGALLAAGSAHIARGPKRTAGALSWAGLVAIIGAALLFDNHTGIPGYAAALPVVGAGMVVLGGTIAPGRGAESLLGIPPFQLLGKWSYSLYLWHWPVLTIAAQRAGHELSLAENLGLVAAALVLAAATHYVVENPVRYAQRLTRSPWTSISVGACFLLVALSVCVLQIGDNTAAASPLLQEAPTSQEPIAVSSAVAVDPVEQVLAAIAKAPDIQVLPANLRPSLKDSQLDFAWLPPWGRGCLVDKDVVDSPECIFGDPQGQKTVVLLGDSHMAQWMRAFDVIGLELHWKVVVLAKTQCPAAAVDFELAYGTGASRFFGPYAECSRWQQNAIDRINELNPDAVIFGSCNGCEFMVDPKGEPLTRAVWQAGIEKTLLNINAPNTRKIVIGDIPRIPGTADCLALHGKSTQSCSLSASAALARTYNDSEESAASAAGATFVDPTAWFCGAVCTAVVGNIQVYSNDYHVTATYSLFIAPLLQAAIEPLMDVVTQ